MGLYLELSGYICFCFSFLTLSNDQVLEEVLHALSLLMADSEELVELDLSDCVVFSASHADSLAEGLATNTHLKKLSLKGTKMQTDAAVAIAQVCFGEIGRVGWMLGRKKSDCLFVLIGSEGK